MAWIEVHQELPHHPKTDDLMDGLGVDRPTAVGLVVSAWLYGLQYAQNGVISTDRLIRAVRASGWQGEPAVFASAMVRAGYWDVVDDGWYIHDWAQYAQRLIERREADRERKRGTPKDRQKSSAGTPPELQRTACVPNQPNQPNHTHHDEGVREEASPSEDPAPARDSLRMPKGEPLGDALHPENLFSGEIEILEAEFLGPRIKAFWQLTSGDRAKILNWLEFPKDDRRRAWNFALGEEWAKAKFSVAYGALTQPGKYPKFNPNVVQLRPVAAERPPSPYAGKPWASIWAPEMKGTVSDRDYMWRQARRAHDLGGGTCDIDHAMGLFAGSGVETAMDYVWGCYAQNKARGHAAG